MLKYLLHAGIVELQCKFINTCTASKSDDRLSSTTLLNMVKKKKKQKKILMVTG